jgi:chemotaxis protein histidine kinase CheA
MSHDALINRLRCDKLGSWSRIYDVLLEAADRIEAQAEQINALHRRAQQAEAACVEKAGSADGSLGRALANATANHWRAQAEAQTERIAELEQRSVMLATENTDLREMLTRDLGSGWEDMDAACYRAQQRTINKQAARIAELEASAAPTLTDEQIDNLSRQFPDHFFEEDYRTFAHAVLEVAQEKKP